MRRYNVDLTEAHFHLGKEHKIRFRPKGKVVCHDADWAEQPTEAEDVTRFGKGGLSARIFVGLSVGENATFTVKDVVDLVVEIRKKQDASPDASILTQKGIYEDKAQRVIVEESVQIVIIDLGGSEKKAFTDDMLDLAEALCDELEQETVIVEIQRRGVVADVYGVTP